MIHVNQPYFNNDEMNNVQDCMKSGWISTGKYIEKFEELWSGYCSMQYGVAVSNGTMALELAVRSLEFKPGGEVILPSFTIISCALAVIRSNLVPVFVDVDPNTWCIDPDCIEKAITDKTVAVMPVHMYGHPCDMTRITNLANNYGLKIIEDAAQAHGSEYYDSTHAKWRKCGSFGDVSCFSFYNNKKITTGEGGMVLTNSHKTYLKLRDLRNLCFGNGDSRFYHSGIGYNARMTNIQAAIGVAQFEKLSTVLLLKDDLAKQYSSLLRHKFKSITHQSHAPDARYKWWMYGILVNNRDKLANDLQVLGIETRPFFVGMHKQQMFDSGLKLPVTEYLSQNGLYIPSGVNLTNSNIEYITSSILRSL